MSQNTSLNYSHLQIPEQVATAAVKHNSTIIISLIGILRELYCFNGPRKRK